MSESRSLRTVVLVPIKQFSIAKSRLRDVLGDDDVEVLARQLAERVLRATRPLRTLVVCDDDEVAAFAAERDVDVVRTNEPTLNGAVTEAYRQLVDVDQVIVVHADLKRPHGLGAFRPGPGVTVVTDHHRTGTNVLALPARVDFHFAYGEGSAHRHRVEAERLGLECTVVTDSPWGYDVDEPRDLETTPDGI
jgi:2-phospho-L-lactate guanylyltransferase